MKTLIQFLGISVLAILLLLFVAAMCCIPMFFLWNWLMPVVFGLPTITLVQALGLSILSGLMFRTSAATK